MFYFLLCCILGDRCPYPSYDENMDITIPSADIGQVAYITCTENYTLENSPETISLECLPTLQWNATVPRCIRKYFYIEILKNE